MQTTTEAVANYFIDKACETGCSDLTQMKLQKLVYYAHGWYLGLDCGPLFAEPVQAWKYGPVLESLRHKFRKYGSDPISSKAKDIRFLDTGKFQEFEHKIDDKMTCDFLNRIWNQYGKFSAIQLANMTHEPGTPWHQVASHYQFTIPKGITIPNAVIKDYFSNCVKNGRAA